VKDGTALFGVLQVEKKGQPRHRAARLRQTHADLALPNGIRSAVISPDGMRFAMLGDPRPKDPLAEVHHVAENDVTSIYVSGISGAEGGAWWCLELNSIVDVAWSRDGSQMRAVTQTPKIGNHDFRSSIYVL